MIREIGRRTLSRIAQPRQIVVGIGVCLLGYAGFVGFGMMVLDAEPPPARLVAMKSTTESLFVVLNDGTPNLRIHERIADRDRFVGVVRGHEYEIAQIAWDEADPNSLALITTDVANNRRRTRIDGLDSLPVVEREHLDWIRRNLWLTAGRPVVQWTERQIASAAQGLGWLTPPLPEPGTRFTDCAGCPEMIVLPRGHFHDGIA